MEQGNRHNEQAKEIEIVEFIPEYQHAFRALNEEWITQHWQLEASDYKILDHPKEAILDKGGHIFVGLYRNEPVGVCALMKNSVPGYDFEIGKYAVTPRAQGKGLGYLLCKTAVDKAIELGGKRIFIESNTILHPALHIYEKLGFKVLPELHPAYARGDIQLELIVE